MGGCQNASYFCMIVLLIPNAALPTCWGFSLLRDPCPAIPLSFPLWLPYLSLANALINTLSELAFCPLSSRHLYSPLCQVTSVTCKLSKHLTPSFKHRRRRYHRLPSSRLHCHPCWCRWLAPVSPTACPRCHTAPAQAGTAPSALCGCPSSLFTLCGQDALSATCVHWPLSSRDKLNEAPERHTDNARTRNRQNASSLNSFRNEQM